jgi:hypothetical protein
MIEIRSQFGCWIFAAVLLTVVVGCSPRRVGVSGNVSLNGQPVNEAVILFVPLEMNTKKTGGVIVNGKYEIAAELGLLPGKYRVEILDDPPLGMSPAADNPVVPRRHFPQHYAHDSPLHAKVLPKSDELKLDFALTLMPQKQ